MTPIPTSSVGARVQRQISLPLAKALEIAYKNIRMRLNRSLLVTSGIVLALAFLMSILTSDALTTGMRGWANTAPQSTRFTELRAHQADLERQRTGFEAELRAAAHTAPPVEKPVGIAADKAKANAKKYGGKELAELQKELGVVNLLPANVELAVAADASLAPRLNEWIRLSRQVAAARDELSGPQLLIAMMQAAGVPTTPQEIANNRIQTRWLLGLALLVAFVGILNAMLMSVTERFREIGTMKCLGALDGFIVKLFLLESLFQGAVGTVIGVTIGLLLSLLAMWSNYGAFAWKAGSAGSIALGALACLAVGVGLTVAAAVYPAWQAARMQPIDAMRVEA